MKGEDWWSEGFWEFLVAAAVAVLVGVAVTVVRLLLTWVGR